MDVSSLHSKSRQVVAPTNNLLEHPSLGLRVMQPQRPTGPSLPSIRTLHPYLPPPTTSHVDVPTQYVAQAPATVPAPAPSSDADSDELDDRERDHDAAEEPPKKKRRRQALSCTECKRRKIRCDRKQPCGPCARRGEQAKCQWHLVEPAAEKYVPRIEHDALRARVDALEAYLQRIPPSVLASLPPFPSGAPIMSPMPTASGLPAFAQQHRLPPLPTRSPPHRSDLSGPGHSPYSPATTQIAPIEALRPIYPRPRSSASTSSAGDLRRHASSPIDLRRQEQQPSRAQHRPQAGRRSSQQPSPYAAFHPPPSPLTTTEPLASNLHWSNNPPPAGDAGSSSSGMEREGGRDAGRRESRAPAGGRAGGMDNTAPGDALSLDPQNTNSNPAFTVRFASFATELDLDNNIEMETVTAPGVGSPTMAVASRAHIAIQRRPRARKCCIGTVLLDSRNGMVPHKTHSTLIPNRILSHRKASAQQTHIRAACTSLDMLFMVIVWILSSRCFPRPA
ncbi:hypothetical protein C8F01DRAFT_1365954 [Mycena amicta]|nr:hypothetical protein C8F01DRAFT_1365954 [Mycena amicta]